MIMTESFRFKSQKEKYEAIMADFSRKAADLTISKIKFYDELKGDSPKEREKIFKEKSIEYWKEFATHGVFRFDSKENKIKLLPFTDLDGKTCLGLYKLAGFNTENITYVAPGEFVSGAINVDTGHKTGIAVSKEDGTAWEDHHGPEATEATPSAAKFTYYKLITSGLLKKGETLDKLVDFVSKVDRGLFSNNEKYFEISDMTILGLQRFLSFENLYDYFKQGRSPLEILSDEDLKKYNLAKRSAEQRKIIENTKEAVENLKQDGFVANTKFGKILIDIGKKIPSGYEGARACGYDGYLLYAPNNESFFVSIKKADLQGANIPQSICVRKNILMKPIKKESIPLKVSLKEIIEKLGGKIPKSGLLKDAIDMMSLKTKEFIVKPQLSRDKKGVEKYITWDFGKLAIFPENFKPESGKKYKVRIKSDTAAGERKGFYILEVL